MFFLQNEIENTVALSIGAIGAIEAIGATGSTGDKSFGSGSINELFALQFEWLYLLLSLLIGLLIGIRVTYRLLDSTRKQAPKQTKSAELAVPRAISNQTAHSINGIIRNLVNSQFVSNEKGSKASYLQTPLRESIRQLRVISSHIKMSEASTKANIIEADHPQDAILTTMPTTTLTHCELRNIIDEQFALAQSYLDDYKLSLQYEFDDECFVAIPADWLRKAIRELMLNAVKHNKHKDGLAINLHVAISAHHVLLNICDNGQGIPSEVTSAINQPSAELIELQSLINPGYLPIDLSAIQVYLLQQKGGLCVSSARHFMTKVCLKLPLVKPELQAQYSTGSINTLIKQVNKDQLPSTLPQVSFNSCQNKHHFPNLLIVNLDQVPISNARTVLYQHFTIFDASSLPQAVEIIKQERIDCVLVDAGTTGTYTIDTFNFLRKHEQCKSIPCVIIGAEIDKTSQLQMLNVGLSALLVHPVQGEQISKVLKNLLQEKQSLVSTINEDLAEYVPEHCDITPSSNDNAFGEKFQKLLQQHYCDEDFNRQLAAEYMLMHERTLHRRLSEHFGLNFSEMLKKYRLQIAKQMIENGDNVTTAAYETGFNSPSYFARCFKSEFGTLPSTLSKHAY